MAARPSTAKRLGIDTEGVGVGVLRVAAGKIAEVWLFTADLAEEDAFWECRVTRSGRNNARPWRDNRTCPPHGISPV